MILPKLAALSFAALLVAMPSSVAGTPQGCADGLGSRQFTRIDANKDGRITEDEASTAGVPFFQHIDSDGDGVVTDEEFQTVTQGHNPERAHRLFVWLDRNYDGRVTIDEAISVRLALLRRVDTDGDGAATIDEVKAAIPCSFGARSQ